jgi:hypothetical protein
MCIIEKENRLSSETGACGWLLKGSFLVLAGAKTKLFISQKSVFSFLFNYCAIFFLSFMVPG